MADLFTGVGRVAGRLCVHLRIDRCPGAAVAAGPGGCAADRQLAVIRRLHPGDSLGVCCTQRLARLGGIPSRCAAGADRLLATAAGAPGMKQTLTQSMAWLHAWGGLLFGWLLFAIFLTGSLAVFDQEIDHWMQPEIKQTSVSSAQAVEHAVAYLQRQHADASAWNISLPSERMPALRSEEHTSELQSHVNLVCR